MTVSSVSPALKFLLVILVSADSSFSSNRKVGGFMWAWNPVDGYNRTRELTSDVAMAMNSEPEIHDFLSVMLGDLDVEFNGELNETIFVANEKLIEINYPIFRNKTNGTELYLPLGQIPTLITSGGIPYGHRPKDWFVINPNDKRFDLDRFFSQLIPFMRRFGLSGVVLDDESFCAPRIEPDDVDMWFKYVNLLGDNLHKYGYRLKVFMVCASFMKIDNITLTLNNSSVDVWISMDTYSGDFDFWKTNIDYYYKPLGAKFSPGLYPVTLEQPSGMLSRDVLNLYTSYLLVAAPKVQEIWLFCYPAAYQNKHLYSAMSYWRNAGPDFGGHATRHPVSDVGGLKPGAHAVGTVNDSDITPIIVQQAVQQAASDRARWGGMAGRLRPPLWTATRAADHPVAWPSVVA